jgi:hypothetical protein
MKTLFTTSVLTALLISGVTVMAQNQNEDYLGLPGDNLNLYAVMNLFQESKTLEEFERNLNDENSRINNLDLNGDNLIDYISVFDIVNDNVHNIVLQVPVSQREKQDVAVFTVVRDKKGNVIIQLTGDEALYGKNYIIEPNYDDNSINETPNPGYTGNVSTINGREVNVIRTTYVEVAAWPLVSYIYSPGYVVWRSSWYWGYYPSYWSPWRPYYWHYYYGYHYNWYDHYYSCYRPWHHHRHTHWNDYYYRPHHIHSATVNVYVREGNYKTTYSRPEERKKGEALYASTHRDEGNRRKESVRVADQNRRSESAASTERSSGNGSSGAARRTENSSATRPIKESQSAASERSTVERSNSQVRSSGNRSYSEGRTIQSRNSENRPAESKASSPSRTAERKSPSQAGSAEKRTIGNSKSAAPERRDTRPKESVKRESQTKSKESDTKREIKEESKRR